MFVEVAKKGDIAPGGMIGYGVAGKSITICNESGQYYALARRCGHMSAALDEGTLVGYILTCPMHYAQFDIKSGHVLSGPVLHDAERGYMLGAGLSALFKRVGGLTADIKMGNINKIFFRRLERVMAHVKTDDLKTFTVRVEGGSILVDL